MSFSLCFSANETCINVQNELRASCTAGTFLSQRTPGDVFTCAKCALGKMSASQGASECTSCTPGTFTAATGLTECQRCAAGTFLSDHFTGAVACTKCALGKVSASEGASECTSCTPGTFTAATGLAECQRCVAGTFLSDHLAGAVACTKCALGTVSATEGASECTSCLPGAFTAATGLTACQVRCYVFTPSALVYLRPVSTIDTPLTSLKRPHARRALSRNDRARTASLDCSSPRSTRLARAAQSV